MLICQKKLSLNRKVNSKKFLFKLIYEENRFILIEIKIKLINGRLV